MQDFYRNPFVGGPTELEKKWVGRGARAMK